MEVDPRLVKMLDESPWGFGVRPGGGGGMPGARNLWAEAIVAAGAGGGVPHGGFTAPPIVPGRKTEPAEQNYRPINLGHALVGRWRRS